MGIKCFISHFHALNSLTIISIIDMIKLTHFQFTRRRSYEVKMIKMTRKEDLENIQERKSWRIYTTRKPRISSIPPHYLFPMLLYILISFTCISCKGHAACMILVVSFCYAIGQNVASIFINFQFLAFTGKNRCFSFSPHLFSWLLMNRN